jgi:hypothetical protein
MKLIRLPSGPLAYVFPVEQDSERAGQRGKDSGVYRAFSGSVEADGPSEDQAIQALDAEVRRLSVPPPAEIEQFEMQREVANDVSQWDGSSAADYTGRYPRYSEHPTIPAPASSSRR